MSEVTHIGIIEEKIDGLCDKNGLTYSLNKNHYPILLIVKPLNTMDNQISMLESSEADKGKYISPDARIIFSMSEDGKPDIRTEGKFTISDALYSKFKDYYKRYYQLYCQLVHKECVHTRARLPEIDVDTEDDDEFDDEFEDESEEE